MTPSKAILILPLLVCIAQSLIHLDESYVSNYGKREGSIHPFQPKVFYINLDLDYEERWKGVMKDVGHIIPELFDVFWVRAGVSEDVISFLTYEMLLEYDEEYAKELKAISNLINYPFARIAFLNVFYDVTTECTSLIVQDTQNNLIHSKNLDFGYGMGPIITKMIFHARFIKGGKVLYEAVTKVGQVGLLTAIKDGKLSINLNQNMEPGISEEEYWKNVKSSIIDLYAQYKENFDKSQQHSKGHLKKSKMYLSPIYIARKAIEAASNYEEVVDILERTPTITRVYYVVTGVNPGEGTVIQKFKDVTEDVAVLNPDNDVWFLAQSNYVRSQTDPANDNKVKASAKLLFSIGKENITKELVWEIMQTYPVLNNGTVHTSVMQAKTNMLKTTIWGWGEHRIETAIQEILEDA